jgi:hypothetical protein
MNEVSSAGDKPPPYNVLVGFAKMPRCILGGGRQAPALRGFLTLIAVWNFFHKFGVRHKKSRELFGSLPFLCFAAEMRLFCVLRIVCSQVRFIVFCISLAGRG